MTCSTPRVFRRLVPFGIRVLLSGTVLVRPGAAQVDVGGGASCGGSSGVDAGAGAAIGS